MRHQLFLREHVSMNSEEVGCSMSREEFQTEINNGRMLVILDDLVLDVSEFV